MNKKQIIDLAVAKLYEKAIGISVIEIHRIITKVADLVEEATRKNLSNTKENK